MTQEKWNEIQDNIKEKFEVFDKGHEFYEEEGGVDVNFIEFKSPLGRIRLEFIKKPIVLDKKTTYSHRGGSDTGVEYIYSSTEKSSRLEAYRWSDSDNDWIEIEVGKINFADNL